MFHITFLKSHGSHNYQGYKEQTKDGPNPRNYHWSGSIQTSKLSWPLLMKYFGLKISLIMYCTLVPNGVLLNDASFTHNWRFSSFPKREMTSTWSCPLWCWEFFWKIPKIPIIYLFSRDVVIKTGSLLPLLLSFVVLLHDHGANCCSSFHTFEKLKNFKLKVHMLSCPWSLFQLPCLPNCPSAQKWADRQARQLDQLSRTPKHVRAALQNNRLSSA